MKPARTKGFVLVLVIVALSFTAVVMAVLTAGANTMLFHADRAQCQAVQRNLHASGLAWAQHHVAEPNATVADAPVALDAAALSDRPVTLTVAFLQTDTGSYQCRVEATCSRGRQTLDTTQTHVLSPTK
jgi:hypothetical protein